ncbi:tetratricopeptide repeat protein, partial [Salmonella enterica]|uniref:tetratricopeptide repeat protein n=1 Tax=Salmonella enterica TaxID=28901 RepID=UPI003299E790
HGDLPEAEHHLREASAILAAELGESHTFTARTNYHLARITAAQGRREEAIRYCRMALAVQRDLLSSGDAQLA